VCHSGNQKEGKLDISSYESLMKGGKTGELVKPGNRTTAPCTRPSCGCSPRTPRPMPPKGDLPCAAEEAALIKMWIDQGAKAPTSIRVAPEPVISHAARQRHPRPRRRR